MVKIKHIFSFLLFCTVLSVSAQQYYFKQYTTEDGLAQSQVRALFQDDFGYLWIGTANGLSKFDGKTFKNYTSNKYIVDAQVNAIFKRKKGGVWVVTTKGISSFNEREIITKDLTKYINDGNIYHAAEDSEGNVWCVVYKKGLLYLPFDESTPELYPFQSTISSIHINSNDKIYLAGEYGQISRFSKTDKNLVPIKVGSKEKKSRMVKSLDEDLLAVSTEDSLLFIHNDRQIYSALSRSITLSREIYVDSEKSIWVLSKSGALKLNQEGEEQLFNVSNGMPFESSRTILEDKNHNIWIGTEGGGLLKFFPNQEFVTYTKKDGLPSEQVMSVSQVADQMWFSTYSDGIFIKDNSGYKLYNTSNGLPNNTVWSSAAGNDGKLWFGTNQGLACYQNNEIKVFTTEQNLPTNRITALYFDRENTLWIGWKDGVVKMKNGKFTNYGEKEGFGGYRVRHIKEDEETLYFGCKNGVFTIAKNEFKPLVYTDSLSKNSQIYSIEVLEHHLAIGTSSGLYFLNKSTGKTNYAYYFDREISQPVYFLQKEAPNILWLGSADGVWRYELEESSDAIKIALEQKFGKKNGIANLETNQNSSFIDREGRLWFGTGMGLVRQAKSKNEKQVEVLKKEQEPQIKISNVRLFLEKINLPKQKTDTLTGLAKNLVLKHNQNHITFDYQSIYLQNPEEILYQFKLEGFDDEWLPVTQEETFTYSNLPYGSFTFMVKSSFDGKTWSEPTTYSFVIKPPFWLTNWFLIIVFTLLVFSVYGIYIWRTNVINRKRETERLEYKNKLLALEQQSLSASMNRHFIFNALNSIQYYINTQDRLSANKYLSSFAKLIRKNLESSGTKNNVIPLKEELDRVKLYLELESMRFQNKIVFSIDVDQSLNSDEIYLPPMFFQPFIENSIWHGILPKNGGEINLTITKTDDKKVKISIQDDGVGVETSLKSKASKVHQPKGVSLTKRRIKLLEKTINKKIEVIGPKELKDDKNNTVGTKVEIFLPLESVT